MSIFDRFVLFIFSVAVILLAALSLLTGFGFYSQTYVNTIVDSLYHDYDIKLTFISASIIFVIIGIFLVIRSMYSKKEMTFSTNSTDYGQIKISLETLENIALGSVLSVKGPKEPKVKVRIEEDESAAFIIKVLVDGETPIPQLSEEIQHNVKDNIEKITGLSVNQVHIVVTNVSNNKINKKKSKLE
ncbi:MAG: alkaline shock response membrane anchor protein AmaP [Vulcanibacillus sp.]